MPTVTPKITPESPLMDIPETVRYLKICRTGVYELKKQGILKPVKIISRRTLFLKADLDAFIASRRAA